MAAKDPIKTAEQRGYSRGYAAGIRRKRRENESRDRDKRKNAAWNRAFIACLQTCIDVRGWTCGDKPINNIPERTKLARDFADEAMRYMKVYP